MGQLKIGQHIQEISNQIESAKKILAVSTTNFDHYHYFLIHCAIIYNILNPNTKPIINKDGQEDPVKEKLRRTAEERRKQMRDYFGENYAKFILHDHAKSFRNHLEHIDERIDTAVLSGIVVDKNLKFRPGNSAFIINTPNKESLLRGYDYGRFTFYNETFDTERAKKWLDDIDVYIKQKGIPDLGCSSITNNIEI